jgi:hypothetical protein
MGDYNDPRYRAAMEANRKLMADSGEKPRTEGMSVLDEVANGASFSSIEEMMAACATARPVDDYQQQILDAMKSRETYIILIFGPGHGQTMRLRGEPADEIVWQEAENPIFAAVTDPLEEVSRRRNSMHRYRLSDEMESAQMEEVAIYVHHERCCDKRFDRNDTTARHERMPRQPRDVFNQPHLRNRNRGGGIF